VAEPGWGGAARTDRKLVRRVFCPRRAAKGRLRRALSAPTPPAGRRGGPGAAAAAAAGLRVPEPDGERGAGSGLGGGRFLPLRHPLPRRRAAVVSGAGLGRGRVSAGRGAAGDFRGARPPLPRPPWSGGSPSAGALCALSQFSGSSQVEQHSLFLYLGSGYREKIRKHRRAPGGLSRWSLGLLVSGLL